MGTDAKDFGVTRISRGEIGALADAWPDADEMRRAHPVDAQVAEEILTFVAQTLAEPRFAANRPTALRIYMT